MTRFLFLTPLLIGCVLLMTACAPSRPVFAPVQPPRRILPEEIRRPCALPVLPAAGPIALTDLEKAYVARGAALVACDAARDLAVTLHDAEHADEDAWLKARKD